MSKILIISKLKEIKYVIDTERLRPIDADLQIPDMSKFQEKTGWEPRISYQQTLGDLLEFWRNKVIKSHGKFLTR